MRRESDSRIPLIDYRNQGEGRPDDYRNPPLQNEVYAIDQELPSDL